MDEESTLHNQSTTTQRVTDHGESVAVPAEAPLHVEAALVGPARDHVLHGAGQNVAVVRQPRRERRPVVERVPEDNRKSLLASPRRNRDTVHSRFK